MFYDLKALIRIFFYKNINLIPDEYRDEFHMEFVETNLAREKTIAYVLLVSNFLLVVNDFFHLSSPRYNIVGYRNLFIGHIVMLIIVVIFIFLCNSVKKYKQLRKISFENMLYLGMISFALNWCVFASINAQLLHNQVSAYYVCIFCVGAFLEMKPDESFAIFLVNYIALIIGVIVLQKDLEVLRAHIINVSMITVFAYAVSRLKFNASIYNFMNRKVIMQKTRDLEETQRNLKKLVDQQSEELVKEMSKRHALELESIINEQRLKENTKILDEKIKYEKLRTEFFANISHELRTPLNVIFSVNQMLDITLSNSEIFKEFPRVPKYLYTTKQNCYRLLRLINNLIDITKIDSGYFEISPIKCNIVKIVEDITLSIAEYVDHKNINLIFDTEVEEMVVACDPDKIERIMLNLLSNAVKFTPAGGEIFVNVYDKADEVEISVRDTGIGIPLDKQEAVFDRFIQVDSTLSRKYEGSGIGLSLVKSLVEMHNGTMSLISEEGKGSEFIINLPAGSGNGVEEFLENNEYNNDSKIERIHVEFSDIYY